MVDTFLVSLGPDNPLVREALLHREVRLEIRLLLPLHPPHRPTHSRPRG